MSDAESSRSKSALRAAATEARFFVVQVWRSRSAPASLRTSVRAIGGSAPGRAPEYFESAERLVDFLGAAVPPIEVGGRDD